MSVKGEVSNFMPDYYKGVYEMEKLLEAEDFILGGVGKEQMRILYNEYVMPADLQGVQIFENQLGIVPDVGDSLEERKQTILIHMLPPQPITKKFMKIFLKNMNLPVGFNVNHSERVAIINGERANLNDAKIKQLQYILNVYLPANMGKKIRLDLPNLKSSGMLYLGGAPVCSTKVQIKGSLLSKEG